MKHKIEKAFKDFDKGIRPEGYRAPKHWYVLSDQNKSYPAKGIWALATRAERTSSFNSIDARKAFAKYGFVLLDTRQIKEDIEFNKSVDKAKNDSNKKRMERLNSASKKPAIEYLITKNYKRNPDVVAEVLLRAKGICEACNKKAPFNKKTNGKPFLEVHHIKQLANDGDDTVKNAQALCPNCHREKHHG